MREKPSRISEHCNTRQDNGTWRCTHCCKGNHLTACICSTILEPYKDKCKRYQPGLRATKTIIDCCTNDNLTRAQSLTCVNAICMISGSNFKRWNALLGLELNHASRRSCVSFQCPRNSRGQQKACSESSLLVSSSRRAKSEKMASKKSAMVLPPALYQTGNVIPNDSRNPRIMTEYKQICEKLPSNIKMIFELYPGDIQLISDWYWMTPEWYPSEIWVISEWQSSDIQVIFEWFLSDIRVISKWYQWNIRLISKWYPSDIFVISE